MMQQNYDVMWRSFCSLLEKDRCDIDLNIANKNDTRRGVTALAFLESNNTSVTSEIEHFQRQLHHVEPQQYYYPTNELHLTILSIISCIEGFRLTDINPRDYVAIFYRLFNKIDTLEIAFKGVTASSSCIVIQGFPIGSGLDELRDGLRKQYKLSGLRSSIDSRYKIATAHVSAVRFCSKMKDKNALYALCEKYREHNFGTIKFTKFELVFNNWYQNLSVTKRLAKYSI